MQVPSKLKSGDDFRSGVVNKINSIIDYLSSQRIRGDNQTVSVNQFANGITIKAIANPVSQAKQGGNSTNINDSPIPAIVTEGNSMIGYTVTLYANGYDQASTGTATAFLIQGNAQLQLIPPNTKIMVFPYDGMLDILG